MPIIHKSASDGSAPSLPQHSPKDRNIKIISRILIAAVILLHTISLVLYYVCHPTSLRYNDRWIVGNNISSVEARYGKCDINTGKIAAYYLYNYDTNDYYYYMYYDSDGTITSVKTDIQIGG